MNSKYFNITVKPEMLGSLAVTTFADDDVLFNWTKFEIPRGCARLIGVTSICAGKNGARQEFATDLYFARGVGDDTDFVGAPGNLGTVNATADSSAAKYMNHIIGTLNIPVTDFRDGLDFFAVSHTDTVATGAGFTLQTDNIYRPTSTYKYPGSMETFYLAGIAKGAWDFNTGVLINDAENVAASTSAVDITVDGTDARKVFAVGDVIIAQDDAAVGTVTSVPDATSVFVDAVGGALLNNDELLHKNPITYILHFEM